MKHILGRGCASVLAQFAASRLLLAFDFDGTLAPIASTHQTARMKASTRRLLAAACKHYPTAVISGRSLTDLEPRLAGIGVQHVIGNHGLEPAPGMAAYAEATAAMRQALAKSLPAQAGIEIEDKRYSLAIHYRKALRPLATRGLIVRASKNLARPPRIVLGKAVVNLVPAGAPDKGLALQRLRSSMGLQAALFVGDDITDEDVFDLREPDRLLAIRVGRSRSSAAPYFIRDQDEIDALLARLIALRSEETPVCPRV